MIRFAAIDDIMGVVAHGTTAALLVHQGCIRVGRVNPDIGLPLVVPMCNAALLTTTFGNPIMASSIVGGGFGLDLRIHVGA
jgi:hypothetical protein